MINDPEQVPHLVRELSEPLRAALDRALLETVDRETAAQVLAAFDEQIADLPRRAQVDAEIQQETEAIQRLKDAALAKLAGTTGPAYAPWRRGHYVVALDGEYIGDVYSRTTTGHNPPRYSHFVGRPLATFVETAVFKAAGEAAHQVAADHAKAKGITLDD